MLSPDELKKRIHAARVLRGVSQEDLQSKLAEDGLGRRELGRIERGELPLTRVRRVALAEALRVPEAWFVSEDLDELTGYRSDVTAEQGLDEMRRATRIMEQLLAQLGRDGGRRDLQSHPATDRPAEVPADAV